MSSLTRKLDPIEIRILGSLLEKEQTTPEAYPLTVNSLLAACNQKTNRDPVTQLSETEVVEGLDRLLREGFVWRNQGARAERWEQRVSRRWGLDPARKALLTLLFLRGPQTAGELHSRSERMHAFASLQEAEETLRRMAAADEPLVAEMPRRPGQKENRWIHLPGDPPEPASEEAPEPFEAAALPRSSLGSRVEALEAAVAQLAADLDEIKKLLL